MFHHRSCRNFKRLLVGCIAERCVAVGRIIDPYTDLPEDTLTIQFTLSTVTETFARYENEFVFRQSLDDFMISNLTANDSTAPTQIVIYDVPVIQAEYYDSIDQGNFELVVLQNIIKITVKINRI